MFDLFRSRDLVSVVASVAKTEGDDVGLFAKTTTQAEFGTVCESASGSTPGERTGSTPGERTSIRC